MNITKFLEKTYKVERVSPWYSFQEVRPRIVCNDWFTMSVQAWAYVYCNPRKNWRVDYDKVEIWYPSESEDSIMEYAECSDEPLATVYAYVPIEKVDSIIDKHGWIDAEKTFNKK